MTTAPPNENDLARAMALFEETTAGLASSYAKLQEELRELRAALEVKGRELDDSLAERDRLASYLEQLLESVPSGVVALDPEGRITTLNRAAQEIAGLAPEALGADFIASFPSGADGLAVNLSGADHEIVSIRRSGERVLLELSVSPFLSAGGELLGRVVVFDDVTRLKRLEEQDQRNRRLVAMGEMAAGIAHEIRNPLGSLELFASHLLDELRGGDFEELAGQVLKGIQNLSRISGNLLLYARKIEPARRPVELSEVVAESLLYARAATNARKVTLNEKITPVTVLGDQDLLRQAVLNIVMNSVQAVAEGGTILVECGPDLSEDPPLARIKISDDGPGVPPEARERIFDPFFTTRSTGVGLGLAIVQRIVSSHGGWVALEESELGGAGFTIGLPAAKSEEK